MHSREDRPEIVIGGPIGRADVPRLCEYVRRLRLPVLAEGPVVCDVGALAPADLCAVDALAQMTLAARRQGRGMQLRAASADLRDLLALAGLVDVLPCAGSPRREATRW